LPILSALTSKKVCYFISFFLLGAWLRSEHALSFRDFFWRHRYAALLLCVVSAVIYLSQLGQDSNEVKGVSWWLMNCLLITLSIPWFMQMRLAPNSVNRYLIAMGRNSLPIYLWHVLPLFILKGLDIHQSNPMIYYVASVLVTGMLVEAVRRNEGRYRLTNKAIYGS